MTPNPFKALLYSRKFWLLILDTIIVFALYFVGKYGSESLFEDVKVVIYGLQAVFVTLIGSIAYEDAAEKRSIYIEDEPEQG